MRWWTASCQFVVLLVLSVQSSSANVLAQSIGAVVAAAERAGARTGVAVVDRYGKLLYRHRETEAFAPASNLKIVTALAFLDALGSDFEFETQFWLRDGVLVVHASGDPNWRTGSAHDPAAAFDQVAAALRGAGVRAVRDVRLDPGVFAGSAGVEIARPAQWPADQLHLEYCAPTSAFLLDAGMYGVRVQQAGGAVPAVAVFRPAFPMPAQHDLKACTGKQRPVYGAMDHGDYVKVHGRYGSLREPFEFAAVMQDPARWYEGLLRWRLQAGGIAVVGTAEVGADRLVANIRTPVLPALQRVLEDSSNVDAEQFVRVLGAQLRRDGSLAGGLAALRARLEKRLGGWPKDAVLCDGSGLSAGNRLTPGLIVAALLTFGAGATDNPFRDCLPVAGRTGTLEDRFVRSPLQGRVRAKTGWIRGASSLSGVLEDEGGNVRYFSILMNYDPARGGFNRECKELQERIVAAIAAMESQ